MSGLRFIALLALVLATEATPAEQRESVGARFAVYDIYVDSGAQPLAAWQFELAGHAGRLQVVGVENGGHAAFRAAPYYDRAAVAGQRAERIVVADYSLRPAGELPSGRTRVCRVHVRIAGDAPPQLELRLIAAGNTAGEPIAADISWESPGRERA